MLILDTNVLSALMQRDPDRAAAVWLDGQPAVSVWTTAISVLELRVGIELLDPSRRRGALQLGLRRLLGEVLEGRVLPFDTEAATEAGRLMAARRRAGQAGDLRDTMIAGIAITQRATIATANLRHFADLPVPVVNPWQPRRTDPA